MRKIFSILFAALILSVTACDMNKRPYSVIDPENAMSSMQDAAKLRNYIYVNLRGATSGSWVYSTEVQSDFFNAAVDFGNNGGDLHRWDFVSSLGNASTVWGGCYGVIANNNYVIEAFDNFLAKQADLKPEEKLSEADRNTLKLYKGESYFMRAYMYFQLATYFCKDYDAATAANEYGVSIVLKYAPSSDESSYPGRESLAKTFEQINKDLDSAEALVTTAGKVGSQYITKDVVSAFRARVALYMDDYPTAIKYAEPLVNGETYPLVADSEAYKKLWLNDSGEECIMQLFASQAELPSSSSYNYVNYNVGNKKYSPYYVPTQTAIDLYKSDDIRFTNNFLKVDVEQSTGTFNVYLCNKYPGNPELYQGEQSNYCNAPKPFRIAEQYLILAEAYANTNQDAKASELINKLKANRIPSWTETTLGGDQLKQEIRDERARELFAEGFRFFDLRRYGNGMARGEAQASGLIYLPGDSRTEKLEVDAANFRFVWPIPKDELAANPQMRDQQNEGY